MRQGNDSMEFKQAIGAARYLFAKFENCIVELWIAEQETAYCSIGDFPNKLGLHHHFFTKYLHQNEQQWFFLQPKRKKKVWAWTNIGGFQLEVMQQSGILPQ